MDSMMELSARAEPPEALTAAMALDGHEEVAPVEETTYLIDPLTRRIIPTPIPASLSARLVDIFNRLDERGHRQQAEAIAEQRRAHDRTASRAMEAEFAVSEAQRIGRNLKTLATLLDEAIIDKLADAAAVLAATELAIDCMSSMADRLALIDARLKALAP